MENQPEWLDAMKEPSFYPHRPESVQLVQTHLSWVFLAGPRVYKVKKPVDFGFLDFTTLEKRKFFCKEEIRLNRRLCPEIYLGTASINRDENGNFSLNGGGETIEWAVEMERMPDDGLMSALIQRDEVSRDDINGIEKLLVPFYKMAKAPEEKLYLGGIETVRENCEENFQQIREFVGTALSEESNSLIISYTRQFMAENQDLFSLRQRQGWVVEGHGDLYSANICIDRARDRIYIFDCIEFNERFRYGDVAVDVAFLAMDLDFLGLCDLSVHFCRIFQQDIQDPDLDRLLDFYKCYRAVVRGKIGCFTWAAPGVDEDTRTRSIQQARRYFKLACRYAGGVKKQPRLYVFMGLSGTGKSTAARAFAEFLGLKVFNSDVVRKEYVSGIKATEQRHEPFGQGIYSSRFTQKTYKALARLAGRELIVGNSVVLDATYLDDEKRKLVKEVAEAAGAELIFVVCSCPEEVARKRLAARAMEKEKVSDGRIEIFERQKEIFSEPEEDRMVRVIRLNTDKAVEALVSELSNLTRQD